ncbi:MAG TPA: MOSC domain-containing protein [Hyphomicrobiaceae bacterium]|nr:MOSC domain-containing protein [Hyphomicrobiaceae bacterium]
MSEHGPWAESARLVAVCISAGGVPKQPVPAAEVEQDGLVGDGHNHEKHRRPHRAVTIQDVELLEVLRDEGYPVGPGVMGENLTVRGLHVQQMTPGDRLSFEDGPVLELTEPRRPCYVLDSIHPTVQQAAVGRCGFLARVVTTGRLFPGQKIVVRSPGEQAATGPIASLEHPGRDAQ